MEKLGGTLLDKNSGFFVCLFDFPGSAYSRLPSSCFIYYFLKPKMILSVYQSGSCVFCCLHSYSLPKVTGTHKE